MRKVTPIILYSRDINCNPNRFLPYSFYCITRTGTCIEMSNTINNRSFDSFYEMYDYVLSILKNNNMYAGRHDCTDNTILYDIYFSHDGMNMSRFTYLPVQNRY